MNKQTVEAVKAHALAEYPRESCGLVIAKGRKEIYLPCSNAAQGHGHFMISGQDYADAEDQGQVIMVVHSHPDMPAKPSEADRVACEASGLPWCIVSIMPGGDGPQVAEVISFAPEGYVAPLVGRQFYHGVLDCYTIVQDWFSRQRGIVLPDFEREDNWWEGEHELYLENFEKAGFTPIGDGQSVQVGDVILMQLRSERVNHAAVFIGAEPLKEAPDLFTVPDAMLHHVYGKLSERTPYGGYWREITRLIIRHKDLR